MAWFSLNPERAIKKASAHKELQKQLKETFKSLPDKSQSLLAVADDDWNGTRRQPWVIKLNDKNYNWVVNKSPIWSGERKNPKAFKSSKKLYSVIGGNDIMITWRKTKVGYSAPSTQMQELGSAWILERAVNDNRTVYKSVQDIIDDKVTYTRLVEIFRGDVPEDWLYTYFAQQKKLFYHYNGNSPYNTFNRDGGFMDYITKIATQKFGFPKKDAWDPADIWIIKGSQKKLEQEIDQLTEGDNQTIYELNDYLIGKYMRKEVMGLSLKKISGKKAKFEVVNLNKNRAMYIDTSDPSMNYPVNPSCFQSNFEIKSGKKNFTQDVRLVIPNGAKAKKKRVYDFQIKANSSESETGSNLKFEATQKGAGGARLGKAPVDKIVEILHDLGSKNFVNDYKKYPPTVEDFEKDSKKGEKYFRKVIKELLVGEGGKKMKSDMTNLNDIITNIKLSYESPEDRTTNTRCKLMGLDFFYSMMELGPDKMREFGTDMVYLAQKKSTRKNDKFGPFGKVY